MKDRRGEMGYAEAMLAVMTVSVVLMMYIGSVSTAVQQDTDPLDGLDPDLVGAGIRDGEPEFYSAEYMGAYFSSHVMNGISVRITVPGSSIAGAEVYSAGASDGMQHSRSFSHTVSADRGRTLVAVFEVYAWT